ncbi:Rossmann-like and DUF2520 domain-containing protein [Flavobacterium beibuense]|uniref:DUF2520 multi-domain protein n=1 Tax=Flavobacterium beibuense TaxID=657326 RepID=A0A444WGS2_9FLAO|nr:Rossmann-like and DUF2520 domain-containing protein [Flavobacterium beibuense]RYJ45068.1 DUF2520 multi-domain protein [Flavobacterium beibuense]
MLKVVVIGSGNVAQHLIAVFKEAKDVELVQVFARNPENLAHLLEPQKITNSTDSIKEADIYIISVTDDAIAQVSSSLPFSGKLAVHTSGSVAMEQLDSKNRRGVFYPLQTFSKNKEVNFSIIPLCLESERNEDYSILEQLANQITKSVYNISSQQRKALHVAAVFVSNFANHMYAIGSDICSQNDIPFDILKPLILETADKVLYLDPVKAQTGPAVRNDKQTIEKHLDFITDEKQKEIYKLITQSIQNVKKL